MLEDLNRDEWGQGYRIVIKRMNMKSKNRLGEEQRMLEARKLFPVVTDDVGERVAQTGEARPFTLEDLQRR